MKIIVAIRDRAIDAFGQPFFVQARGQAIRSFQDEINRADANNNLHNHPDDFDLYILGTYEEETGDIKSQKPEMIAIGKDMVTPNTR